ncbi:MAG: hypothetical protein A2156_07715 [Deltaproteobacteria bacterium RBG_16_48_10]|nr:MAG: hypothetical protein A2156_07715 [Deltaproteobacteria bacterium RBG_16_48_10]
MTWRSLKPAVSKTWLIALAGLMWSVVGLMLCRLAYHWLAVIRWREVVPLELLGLVLALTAHQFFFSRIAQKNIARLSLLTEKTCIFAFQRWKSYFLIGLMITVGIAIQNLPIPRPYLAILYTTIGGAVFLASLQYYGCLWRIVAQRGSCLPPGKITE